MGTFQRIGPPLSKISVPARRRSGGSCDQCRYLYATHLAANAVRRSPTRFEHNLWESPARHSVLGKNHRVQRAFLGGFSGTIVQPDTTAAPTLSVIWFHRAQFQGVIQAGRRHSFAD